MLSHFIQQLCLQCCFCMNTEKENRVKQREKKSRVEEEETKKKRGTES